MDLYDLDLWDYNEFDTPINMSKYMDLKMDDDWLNDNVDKSGSFDMFDETGSVSTNNEEDFNFD